MYSGYHGVYVADAGSRMESLRSASQNSLSADGKLKSAFALQNDGKIELLAVRIEQFPSIFGDAESATTHF